MKDHVNGRNIPNLPELKVQVQKVIYYAPPGEGRGGSRDGETLDQKATCSNCQSGTAPKQEIKKLICLTLLASGGISKANLIS